MNFFMDTAHHVLTAFLEIEQPPVSSNVAAGKSRIEIEVCSWKAQHLDKFFSRHSNISDLKFFMDDIPISSGFYHSISM